MDSELNQTKEKSYNENEFSLSGEIIHLKNKGKNSVENSQTSIVSLGTSHTRSTRKTHTISSDYSERLESLLTNTIENPNTKLLIKSVSKLILQLMEEDIKLSLTIDKNSENYYFSEEKYIDDYPDMFDDDQIEMFREKPGHQQITDFIENLYYYIDFPIECIVIFPIYILRLKQQANVPILPDTWRPISICAIQLAQKVFDDKSINNEKLTQVYPFFSNKDFNILEGKFIIAINFSTHVKFSEYTKFFMELKELNFQIEEDIFSKENIDILEEKTRLLEGLLKGDNTCKTNLRKNSKNFSVKF